MRVSRLLSATIPVLFALSGCQCGPGSSSPDASVEVDASVREKDAGRIVVLPDETAETKWANTFAGEPCPAGAFAPEADGGGIPPDGGLRFGLCVVLRTLTTDAFLDGVPETKPVKVQFLAGGFQAELTRQPDPQGVLQVKVMRGRYDVLQHQPAGVWPLFEGFIDHGSADMVNDLSRNFRATSHLLRGAVRFGGVPFRPNIFPQDVVFEGFGTPTWQRSMVTSEGGTYELRMLEGAFGMFLSTPAVSLFGTELLKYPVTPTGSLNLNRDQEFDVDLQASVLEGTVTIDGEAIPDARPGPDFTIEFTRPGDNEATVISHHEGGLPGFTALVPEGPYGTTFTFDGLPNRTYPSRIFGVSLERSVDLRQDSHLSVNFPTYAIEGSILIDGMPARPNPNYNFQIYMFGIAGASAGSSFLLYELPLDSSSFRIKAFPGNYFTVLSLDENFAEDLAAGFWVVDRYYQLQANRSMAISLDTARFNGRITIDGQPPVPNRRVGTLTFRNRALTGNYSWFRRGVVAGDDGAFSVRLPKGEYEVYFTIDPETYPDYASGRQQMFSRVPLDRDVSLDMNYETVAISGPLRVAGEIVKDTIGGPEVGLRLERQQDLQNFEWRFEGGPAHYTVRVPKGTYAVDFVIAENAIDGVAFGNAPMGVKLSVGLAGQPFMNFLR